jgi:hypothetical protein
VNHDPRRLTTEEERERLYAARYGGGLCAVCGEAVDDDAPVYWERFAIGKVGGLVNHPQAPVGAECASPQLLTEKAHEKPERCAGCGRPVYYAVMSRARHRAVCSTRCQMRASRAARGTAE